VPAFHRRIIPRLVGQNDRVHAVYYNSNKQYHQALHRHIAPPHFLGDFFFGLLLRGFFGLELYSKFPDFVHQITMVVRGSLLVLLLIVAASVISGHPSHQDVGNALISERLGEAEVQIPFFLRQHIISGQANAPGSFGGMAVSGH
jgi:hypothetical protein